MDVDSSDEAVLQDSLAMDYFALLLGLTLTVFARQLGELMCDSWEGTIGRRILKPDVATLLSRIVGLVIAVFGLLLWLFG